MLLKHPQKNLRDLVSIGEEFRALGNVCVFIVIVNPKDLEHILDNLVKEFYVYGKPVL